MVALDLVKKIADLAMHFKICSHTSDHNVAPVQVAYMGTKGVGTGKFMWVRKILPKFPQNWPLFM